MVRELALTACYQTTYSSGHRTEAQLLQRWSLYTLALPKITWESYELSYFPAVVLPTLPAEIPVGERQPISSNFTT